MLDKKFIVLVLDGFGMKAMEDAKDVRPTDVGCSTLGSILKDYPDLKLPNLEKLGLMNAWQQESAKMLYSKTANYGRSNLVHYGADTFMGHQEIMGTLPKKSIPQPISEKIDEIAQHLIKHGHKVEFIEKNNLKYLLVDDYCVVADNIDADVGMAYNCTAPLDYMPYEKELEIGYLVREIATVNRVIPFGGRGNTIDDILNAELIKEDKYIGIHAVKSKSYEQGYECRHLGYGVDKNVQTPTILTNHGISVSLFGKVADIVQNDAGKSVSCVSTKEVMDLTIEEAKNMKTGFICTNVQETDLAGHSEDSTWYKNLLELVDRKLPALLEQVHENDIFVIMADHGNDPNIGHNRHTREMVPLLIYKPGCEGVYVGERKSLSDVGATVCDFFGVERPQNGESFLKLLNKE